MNSLKETDNKRYTNIEILKKKLIMQKKLLKNMDGQALMLQENLLKKQLLQLLKFMKFIVRK